MENNVEEPFGNCTVSLHQKKDKRQRIIEGYKNKPSSGIGVYLYIINH